MWKHWNGEIHIKYPVRADSHRPGPTVAGVAQNITLSYHFTIDVPVLLLNMMKLRAHRSDRDGQDANGIACRNLLPTRPLRGALRRVHTGSTQLAH